MSQHMIHFWQGRTEAAYRDVVRLEQENAALAAENERLRKLLEMYLKADPLIGEAVALAMLAEKEGRDAK